MKISEATKDIIAEHCRVSPDDAMLDAYWEAAVRTVLAHTGLSAGEADGHDDLTIAALALARDMFDNKGYNVEAGKANRLVEAVLGLHDNNLLCGG